jgi:hypothetical protein
LQIRNTAAMLVFGACMYGPVLHGQVPQTPTPPADPSTVAPAATPAPAASDTSDEYTGPAVLTRGAGGLFRLPSSSIRIQPYLSLNANYDQGLAGVSIDPQGNVANIDSFGYDATVGLTGHQRRRLSVLSLQYSGNYRHYQNNTYYNGMNQTLTLAYQRQVSKRLITTLRTAAGTYSNDSFGYGFTAYNAIDPAFAQVPQNEIFDNRVYYGSVLADLTYMLTARLSVTAGGDGFVVRRRSSALFGVTGERARGAINYRVTRRLTLGGYYDFTHYKFTHSFGASDLHTTGLSFAYRIGPRTELSGQAGIMRVETLGLNRVAVDPVVAELLGTSYAIEAVYRLNYIPVAALELARSFRRGSARVAASQSSSAGNGVYLTSKVLTVSSGYTYSGIRAWLFTIGADYTRYGSLVQTAGAYNWTTVNGTVSRSIVPHVFFSAQAGVRHYDIQGTNFKRNALRASVGLTFTPSEIPLSLW